MSKIETDYLSGTRTKHHPSIVTAVSAFLLSGVLGVSSLMAQYDPYSDTPGEVTPYENQMDPMGYYFNLGVMGDLAITGYDGTATERDPRLAYQVEIGSRSFAIPVSYSQGQGVSILGIKPRFQYFMPLGRGLFSIGGGIGAVYNYWTSSPEIDSETSNVKVHELGVQPSLKLLVRPLPMMHIMVTPVALDFNFWRQTNLDTGIEGLGNFSTTDKNLGTVYSGGAAVGFNF